MKKLLFGILSLFLVLNLSAQNSKDALKDAEKALKPFFKDMPNNVNEAKAALETLEANFGTPEKAEYFVKKGDLYREIVEEEEKKAFLDQNYVLLIPNAAEMAMKSYQMAMGTDKEKDALKGLESIMGSMTLMGNKSFDAREYESAFNTFNNILTIHEILSTHERDSSLDDPEALNQQKFYTVVAATYAPEVDITEVESIIDDLYNAGYDHSFVYESYFNLLKEKDAEKAVMVLEAGREKYPEDNGLLYAEINYYLQAGELEKPINRIKEAIEKEPENVSLYTTLGSVFDQLNQKQREAGNEEEADKYFEESKSYFAKALELDPENSDANYSIGALYYNKAANMTAVINELSTDYSAEGTKKYEAAKESMMELFKQAQPYFEKAHMQDENNRNAMIALKEIYARLGNFDKSNEMKTKLEAMGG